MLISGMQHHDALECNTSSFRGTAKPPSEHPRSTPEQGMQAGESDMVSAQPSPLRPALWRQGPSESFQIQKNLVRTHLSETFHCAPQRKVTGTPGLKGQLTDAGSPPFQYL